MSVAIPQAQRSTLVDLLRERAARHPERVGYTFLIDGEEQSCELVYGELERRARTIGAMLQSLEVTGERALLLYPPGFEYITAYLGCLYAEVVAVPVYPPRANQSLFRLRAIIADAQPMVVLTITSILASLKRRFAQFPELQALRWLTTDTVDPSFAVLWKAPALTSETLAFLQYTSGSTTAPKGVMLTHGNLLHNLHVIHRSFQLTSETRGMIWLPPYHDMGLIGGILQPLYGGFPVTLMSPYAFLQRPLRWLQAISRTKATSSGGPNFAYELCVRRVTPDQLATLDLSSWDLAFSGAEPVRPETLERFATTFEPCGFRHQAFYPCYGLAESTLFVTGGLKQSPPVVSAFEKEALTQNRVVTASVQNDGLRRLVGSGQQAGDLELIIVDPESAAKCPPGRTGEIWVSGPSVARGYWNRPNETTHAFRAYVADTGEGPFLRTGDMGFLHNGELFVTGRLKDLIIIRGRNYYPHDIELTVEQSHRTLRPGCGAAFSLDVNGEERLVVVHEVERHRLQKLDVGEVVKAISQAVAEHHELRVHAVVLVKPGGIPKTSSGKIRHHACRVGFLDGTLPALVTGAQKSPPCENSEKQTSFRPAYPQTEVIQEWLVARIAEHLRADPKNINIREPFASYGLDSVAAVSLSSRLEDWLGRRLSPNLLWDYQTIESLASYLCGKPKVSEPSDEVLPEHYNFELFPEYVKLKQLMRAVEAGGGNPYFKVNTRITASTTHINGTECINFSAYNYLGMSGDPNVSKAAKEAIDLYGTSVSASRVASGERPFHCDLENEIAQLLGTEDCIVYIGGHTANLSTISTLCGPNDLVVYDAFSHNSVLQGCLLSGARNLPFPHNEWQALDELLREQRRRYQRVLIIIEGVYSMDGDIPDLPQFIRIKKRHKALLMIDEAHSIGVLGEHGRGIGEHFGIDPADVDLWMGTLSKSFASCGGYIAGTKAVVEYLKYTASGFVYSVGISPPNAAAALASLRLLKAEPERVARLHERAKLFLELAQARGLNNGTSKDSPVIPLIVGDSFQCIQLSQALLERGINVQPIIYPAVEDKSARLRFFISCVHTEKQVRFTIDTVAEEFAKPKPDSLKLSDWLKQHPANWDPNLRFP